MSKSTPAASSSDRKYQFSFSGGQAKVVGDNDIVGIVINQIATGFDDKDKINVALFDVGSGNGGTTAAAIKALAAKFPNKQLNIKSALFDVGDKELSDAEAGVREAIKNIKNVTLNVARNVARLGQIGAKDIKQRCVADDDLTLVLSCNAMHYGSAAIKSDFTHDMHALSSENRGSDKQFAAILFYGREGSFREIRDLLAQEVKKIYGGDLFDILHNGPFALQHDKYRDEKSSGHSEKELSYDLHFTGDEMRSFFKNLLFTMKKPSNFSVADEKTVLDNALRRAEEEKVFAKDEEGKSLIPCRKVMSVFDSNQRPNSLGAAVASALQASRKDLQIVC